MHSMCGCVFLPVNTRQYDGKKGQHKASALNVYTFHASKSAHTHTHTLILFSWVMCEHVNLNDDGRKKKYVVFSRSVVRSLHARDSARLRFALLSAFESNNVLCTYGLSKEVTGLNFLLLQKCKHNSDCQRVFVFPTQAASTTKQCHLMTHNAINKNPFSRFETIIFGPVQNDILKLKFWNLNGGTFILLCTVQTIEIFHRFNAQIHKHKQKRISYFRFMWILHMIFDVCQKSARNGSVVICDACTIVSTHTLTSDLCIWKQSCFACGSQSVSVQKQYTKKNQNKTTATATTKDTRIGDLLIFNC